MRKRKNDTILNVTVGDHEYTPDEILSLPKTTMFKQGVKTSNFRLDQQRGVAFYANVAGDIMTDSIGIPLYTLLREQNTTAKKNDFLSKVAAATAAADEANQAEANSTETSGRQSKKERGGKEKNPKKAKQPKEPKQPKQPKQPKEPKQPKQPKQTKKSAKISAPDGDMHGASKRDVLENQMDREQRGHGIVCFLLGLAATLVVLVGVVVVVYMQTHGLL